MGPRTRCWKGQVPRLRAAAQAPFRTPHGPAQPSAFGTLGAGAQHTPAGLYAPHPCLAQVTPFCSVGGSPWGGLRAWKGRWGALRSVLCVAGSIAPLLLSPGHRHWADHPLSQLMSAPGELPGGGGSGAGPEGSGGSVRGVCGSSASRGWLSPGAPSGLHPSPPHPSLWVSLSFPVWPLGARTLRPHGTRLPPSADKERPEVRPHWTRRGTRSLAGVALPGAAC